MRLVCREKNVDWLTQCIHRPIASEGVGVHTRNVFRYMEVDCVYTQI